MIDHTEARIRLGQLAAAAVNGDATVYAAAVDSVTALPAVIVGQPAWEPDEQPCRFDRTRWDLLVVVARPGGNDDYQVRLLEKLWQQVAERLRDAMADDDTLGGACKESNVVRSDPRTYLLAGQDYPAQVITVELYG